MANSLLSLFNQAVSTAGGQARISDPDENSREANLCRLWYEVTRDNVLQTGPWPSTTANARLAILSERDTASDWVNTDPSPGWKFAYSAPSDMLRPRHLHSYMPFEREAIGSATAIMTNQEEAILQYTKRLEDVSKWDNELYLANVFSLATRITMTLNGKVGLFREIKQQAIEIVLLASTAVANEQHSREEAMPEMLSIRHFSTFPVDITYSYPFATLNAVAS